MSELKYIDCVKELIKAEKLLKKSYKILSKLPIKRGDKEGLKELKDDISLFLKEFHKK